MRVERVEGYRTLVFIREDDALPLSYTRLEARPCCQGLKELRLLRVSFRHRAADMIRVIPCALAYNGVTLATRLRNGERDHPAGALAEKRRGYTRQ